MLDKVEPTHVTQMNNLPVQFVAPLADDVMWVSQVREYIGVVDVLSSNEASVANLVEDGS